jgi:hypothetical protein
LSPSTGTATGRSSSHRHETLARPSSLRLVATAAGCVLLAGLSGCTRGAHVYDAAGSCADVIEYDGHTYAGVGGLRRDPALTPADVRQSLGQAGSVSASVRCADGRFEALALRAH